MTSGPKPLRARRLVHAAQAVAARRAARIARRRSARGSTTLRPARRCSRPGSRARCAAARRRAPSAPSALQTLERRVALRADARIERSSGKYSFGRPITTPVSAPRRRRRGSPAPATSALRRIERIVAGDRPRVRARRRRPSRRTRRSDRATTRRRRARSGSRGRTSASRRRRRRTPRAVAPSRRSPSRARCGTMPAATAAADPPDDPPGTRSGASGLRVGPNALFSVDEPIANSSMFVLPTTIAPGGAQARDGRRLVRADVALENARAAGRRQRRASRCCP